MRTFLANRHSDYLRFASSWTFWAQAYEGGSAWEQSGQLFRFAKENESAYQERLKRTSRINFTRQIVDLLVQYVSKESPIRDTSQAPESIQQFWQNTSRFGDGIQSLMRDVSTKLALFGTAFVVVDKPSDMAETAFDAAQRHLLPYAYCLNPLDVLDWLPDTSASKGALSQVLIRERCRGSINLASPRESDAYCEQFRLWIKTPEGVQWQLFALNEDSEPLKLDEGLLPISQIPIIQIWRTGGSTIDDIASLDRKVFNYESLLDQILYEQTFSTLLLPWTGQMSDFYEQWEITLGSKSILPYDASASSSPRFIAPDAGQGDLILRAIDQCINQIYRAKNLFDTIGDSSLTAATSGVAKAYDFEKLNAVLSLFADDLEKAELNILNLVLLWCGDNMPSNAQLLDYPNNFDIKTLSQDLQEAQMLSQAVPSQSFKRYLQSNLVSKAMPQISTEAFNEILNELKS